ncbi:MAG: hypothetical protein WStaPseu_18320 [Shewanella algae]
MSKAQEIAAGKRLSALEGLRIEPPDAVLCALIGRLRGNPVWPGPLSFQLLGIQQGAYRSKMSRVFEAMLSGTD